MGTTSRRFVIALSRALRMHAAVNIAPMARHRALLPLVAGWFVAEWPGWYGPGGPGNAWADLTAFAEAQTVLPVGLMAFVDGRPVGAGALKAESIASHKHLSPWAVAGYVLPEFRGRGIGAALLASLAAKGRAMGYETIYCGTSTSQSLLMRCGWQAIDATVVEGKQLTVFRSAA
jgi:GNAT superfamily N-acetyltransferase